MISWFQEKLQIQQKNQVEQTIFSTANQTSPEPFSDFNKDYLQFIQPPVQIVKTLIHHFKYFEKSDEHRHVLAFKDGGKKCGDQGQVHKIRNIGKEMIKDIGMKIISGKFSLTKISFPIKGMVPRTSLETATYGSCLFPLYLGLACRTLDTLEKMKFSITALLAPNYYMNMFLKPLNPVIGETFQASYSDGTQIYCEQISHHPPISYFLVMGPNKSYKYYGYYDYEAKAGLNSGKVINAGKRFIEFPTGEKFQANFPNVEYEGVFVGTLRQSTIGTFKMHQKRHNLSVDIHFGNVKKKPEDFFQANILHNNHPICHVQGSYLGYVQFDGKRYWDGRFVKPFKLRSSAKTLLPSDSSNREDLRLLQNGRLEQAQYAKQLLEEVQRRDGKLRKEHMKRHR